MEQSTAASRTSPAIGLAPAFRWAFSAQRRPGGDKEATALARAVLEALGAGDEGGAELAADLARATAYVVDHGSAETYRLTMEIDRVEIDRDETDRDQGGGGAGQGEPDRGGWRGRCLVRVADHDAGEDGDRGEACPAGGEALEREGRLRIHRRADGAVAVFLRNTFLVAAELAPSSSAAPRGAEVVVTLPASQCPVVAPSTSVVALSEAMLPEAALPEVVVAEGSSRS